MGTPCLIAIHAAIRDDGSLVAWGCNYAGELDGMPSGTGFRDLACGGYHTGIQNYKTIVFELHLMHCLPQLSVQVLFLFCFCKGKVFPAQLLSGTMAAW